MKTLLNDTLLFTVLSVFLGCTNTRITSNSILGDYRYTVFTHHKQGRKYINWGIKNDLFDLDLSNKLVNDAWDEGLVGCNKISCSVVG
ncbi:hypothetical protein [Aureispira sp. CCB-QB1]|uniref:hypothetical protein n=1 Tax=Aureispira sp. CCB-QB1 TaxID=1313421 RepID=UPI000698DEB6|nr:hypothetical protein [Aureispira sp. CCB-QB1]